MDKQTCKTISDEMRVAAEAIAAAHGLTVKVGGGTYGGGVFKPKVVFEESDAAEQEFRLYAPSFGLVADDFGREFSMGSRRYRIIGILPRSRKFGILALNLADNKKYKLDETVVAQQLRSGR